MTVRDSSGVFRKDLKVIHLKFSEAYEDYEGIAKSVEEYLKRKGLENEFIPVVSGPGLNVQLENVEDFIKKLADESKALKTVEEIDRLIDMLKKAREKRWQSQEKTKVADGRTQVTYT